MSIQFNGSVQYGGIELIVIACDPAEDKPSMYHLEHLRVIQAVAVCWKKVANLLQLPSEVVDIIHHDTVKLSCEDSCREAFRRWLGGEGCKPITWEKLIEVLWDADRSTLAEELTSFTTKRYCYKEYF